jgi:hypothetical protein
MLDRISQTRILPVVDREEAAEPLAEARDVAAACG